MIVSTALLEAPSFPRVRLPQEWLGEPSPVVVLRSAAGEWLSYGGGQLFDAEGEPVRDSVALGAALEIVSAYHRDALASSRRSFDFRADKDE